MRDGQWCFQGYSNFRYSDDSKSGTGSGTITADSGTVSWNSNIGTATYEPGTLVTLTATAITGSTSPVGRERVFRNRFMYGDNDRCKSVMATFT